MANDFNQPLYDEDEIDLRKIIKILIESKKLIISSILIFTIASIIYSLSLKHSFKSSTKLEIGYFEMSDGNTELFELPSVLISDLKVLIMKNPDDKFSQNVSMNSFEKKIISLETTSSSGEKNENFLTEMINYIDERHSGLSALSIDQKKDEISFTKEIIDSELSFIKAKQLNSIQLKQSKIEDEIAKLKSTLPIIDLEISQYEQLIIEDTNNLSLLIKNKEIQIERAANSPTLEQIIFSYKRAINGLNAQKYTNILEIKNLNNQLITLENDTIQSDEIFSLEQQQKTLENQLLMLTSQNTIQTSPIMDIRTVTIKPKIASTILFGLVIGFLTGIFLVFIINFVKSYKESQA
jgi:LPS O-antigen subunit length determinant protein (WzzB/FepE family)